MLRLAEFDMTEVPLQDEKGTKLSRLADRLGFE